jgi:hypothetical protein
LGRTEKKKYSRVSFAHSFGTMLPVRLFCMCPLLQPVFTRVCHN